MPIALPTIEEWIVKNNKKRGIWMCFNIAYNEIRGLKNKDFKLDHSPFSIFDEKYINHKAREEFLTFAKENFPHIKLQDVFDFAPLEYLHWSYCGSIAIDCEYGDEIFNLISQKYDFPDGTPRSSDAVLWYMDFEIAQRHYQERKEIIDAGDF